MEPSSTQRDFQSQIAQRYGELRDFLGNLKVDDIFRVIIQPYPVIFS